MKLLSPSIPSALSKAPDITKLLRSDERLSELLVENVSSAGEHLKGADISQSRFNRYDISHSKIEQFELMDCEFKDCDFTASSFTAASWFNVGIYTTRATGLQLSSGKFRNVYFKGCKLDMVNFRFSDLQNVIFEDCVVHELDLYNAKMKNVSFINCDIEAVQFSGAKMHAVDLTQSYIVSLKGAGSLKGVHISNSQLISLAPYLASEIGIIVED